MSEKEIKFACQIDPNEEYISKAEFQKDDGTFRELLLTIDKVAHEEVPQRTGQKKKLACMSFVGKHKRLVFKTKAKRLAVIALYGEKTEDWKGKQIILYWDPTVKFGRDTPGGSRIKGPKS